MMKWPFLLIAILVSAIPGLAGEVGPPFEVHEWGVLVRSKVAVQEILKDGSKNATKNVLVAPKELIEGLPNFVLRYSEPPPAPIIRCWDKPVLHFYGADDKEVTVRVLTPQGKPTVFWPKPKRVEGFSSLGRSDTLGMEWTGRLSKNDPGTAEAVDAKHWWQTAREVPSLWIKTEGGTERFIFYEATATQEPVLTAQLDDVSDHLPMLRLRNSHDKAVGPILVILNDGATRRFVVVQEVEAHGSQGLARNLLLGAEADGEKLLAAARSQWESFGMTKEEAKAIVEVWKDDLLHHPGFLVISRMPEELYEKMFPLTVEPKPDRVIRAGVVLDSLPGDQRRIAWLPTLQEKMDAVAKDWAEEDFEKREGASTFFARLGDMAEPFLLELAKKSKDAEVRARAEALLKGLQPKKEAEPNAVEEPEKVYVLPRE